MNLFIANAAGTLTPHLDIIHRAFTRADQAVSTLIKMDACDVVVIDDPYQAIPETGVGGFTTSRHLIYVYCDPRKKINEDEVFYTFCHELYHARRYDGPGHGKTLFDAMIFEGLSVAFEAEVSGGKGSFLSRFMATKTDTASLVKRVREHFDDEQFDHFHWFIAESPELPRWAGYRVGYQIVAAHLRANNKKASECVMEDSSTFMGVS